MKQSQFGSGKAHVWVKIRTYITNMYISYVMYVQTKATSTFDHTLDSHSGLLQESDPSNQPDHPMLERKLKRPSLKFTDQAAVFESLGLRTG